MTSADMPMQFSFLLLCCAVADTHSVTSIGQFHLQQQCVKPLWLHDVPSNSYFAIAIAITIAHCTYNGQTVVLFLSFVLFYSIPPAVPHLLLLILCGTHFTHFRFLLYHFLLTVLLLFIVVFICLNNDFFLDSGCWGIFLLHCYEICYLNAIAP